MIVLSCLVVVSSRLVLSYVVLCYRVSCIYFVSQVPFDRPLVFHNYILYYLHSPLGVCLFVCPFMSVYVLTLSFLHAMPLHAVMQDSQDRTEQAETTKAQTDKTDRQARRIKSCVLTIEEIAVRKLILPILVIHIII